MANIEFHKVLDSLANIVNLHATSELNKEQFRSNLLHQKAMQDERLDAAEERDRNQLKAVSLRESNKQIGANIFQGIKTLKEYGTNVRDIEHLSEILRTQGGEDIINEKMLQHKGALRTYATDFDENLEEIDRLESSADYNTRVLRGIDLLINKAEEARSTHGNVDRTIGEDARDEVLDLSDFINTATKIGKDKSEALTAK